MLSPGTKLGPYEIVSQLGAGGMGEVYRARDTRLGRDVALKVLPASFASEADRLRRFEQEARAVAPNCWKVKASARFSRKVLCRSARRSSMECRSRTVWRRPTKRGSSTAI